MRVVLPERAVVPGPVAVTAPAPPPPRGTTVRPVRGAGGDPVRGRGAEGATTRRLVAATVVLFGLCALGLSVSVVRSVDTTALGRAASPQVAVALAVLAAVVAGACTLLVLWRVLDLRDGPRTPVALVLLVLVAYPPALLLGVEWLSWAAVLGCFLLELLRPRVAVPLFAAGLLLQVGAWRLDGQPWGDAVYAGVSYLATSVLLYLVLRSVTTYRELERARAELARAAVLRERLRFSRDLHDLLGRNLSAISLKTELARRYQRSGRGEALQAELDQVLALSHAAAVDLRALVAGYRAMSLRTELTAAVRLLTEAGIRCEVDVAEGLTDEDVAAAGGVPAGGFGQDGVLDGADGGPEGRPGRAADEVAGWVLREAATNVVKHADAAWCSVAVAVVPDRTGREALRVVVENDGVRPGPPRSGGGRAGLLGVRERVHALGGSVAVTSSDGVFRLSCTVPVPVPGAVPVGVVGSGGSQGRAVGRVRAGARRGASRGRGEST